MVQGCRTEKPFDLDDKNTIKLHDSAQNTDNIVAAFSATLRRIAHASYTHKPFIYITTNLILSQALPYAFSASSSKILMLALPLLTEHTCSLYVGRALVVGAVEEADGADQDAFRCLDRTPALRCILVAVLVVLGWVQDRDAEVSVFVDVGVKGDWLLEGERGRHMRIARWE
jgi:hypothetical protein